MLVQAEDAGGRFAGAARLGVAADALEDRGAVVDDVGHDVDLGFIPWDEISVVPDIFGCLYGHSCSPEADDNYSGRAMGLVLRFVSTSGGEGGRGWRWSQASAPSLDWSEMISRRCLRWER